MVRPVTTRRARVAENYENLSPLDVNCQKGDRWMAGFFKTHRDEKDDYHVISTALQILNLVMVRSFVGR